MHLPFWLIGCPLLLLVRRRGLLFKLLICAAHSASAVRVDGCAITPFLRGRVRPHRYSVLKVLAVARMDATGRYADTAFSFAMPPDAPM